MRTRNSIGRIVSNRQDLSFEQLRIYYDERGKRLNDNFKRTLELLTDDGKYNYGHICLLTRMAIQSKWQSIQVLTDAI